MSWLTVPASAISVAFPVLAAQIRPEAVLAHARLVDQLQEAANDPDVAATYGPQVHANGVFVDGMITYPALGTSARAGLSAALAMVPGAVKTRLRSFGIGATLATANNPNSYILPLVDLVDTAWIYPLPELVLVAPIPPLAGDLAEAARQAVSNVETTPFGEVEEVYLGHRLAELLHVSPNVLRATPVAVARAAKVFSPATALTLRQLGRIALITANGPWTANLELLRRRMLVNAVQWANLVKKMDENPAMRDDVAFPDGNGTQTFQTEVFRVLNEGQHRVAILARNLADVTPAGFGAAMKPLTEYLPSDTMLNPDLSDQINILVPHDDLTAATRHSVNEDGGTSAEARHNVKRDGAQLFRLNQLVAYRPSVQQAVQDALRSIYKLGREAMMLRQTYTYQALGLVPLLQQLDRAGGSNIGHDDGAVPTGIEILRDCSSDETWTLFTQDMTLTVAEIEHLQAVHAANGNTAVTTQLQDVLMSDERKFEWGAARGFFNRSSMEFHSTLAAYAWGTPEEFLLPPTSLASTDPTFYKYRLPRLGGANGRQPTQEQLNLLYSYINAPGLFGDPTPGTDPYDIYPSDHRPGNAPPPPV